MKGLDCRRQQSLRNQKAPPRPQCSACTHFQLRTSIHIKLNDEVLGHQFFFSFYGVNNICLRRLTVYENNITITSGSLNFGSGPKVLVTSSPAILRPDFHPFFWPSNLFLCLPLQLPVAQLLCPVLLLVPYLGPQLFV